ncbi:MAG: type II toxin-antitoxin system RelE/ParE family toxin [Burkholderiales bacterium]
MPLWRPRAVADRKKIAEYIARDNPMAAVELVDMLLGKASMLDANPKVGRTGRLKGTRELVAHENYVVVYRVLPKTVEILRVLHTSQHWQK